MTSLTIKIFWQSAILDMQREFRAKWDKISSKTIVISGATQDDSKTIISKNAKKNNGSTMAIWKQRQQEVDVLEQLFVDRLMDTVLVDIGLCYFTRPFRDGKSGTRFLSPTEFYFVFAEDFRIIPEILSRSECRELIYNTICDNPEFSNDFRALARERDEAKRIHDEKKNQSIRQGSQASITEATSPTSLNAQNLLSLSSRNAHKLDRPTFLGQALLMFVQNVADLGQRSAVGEVVHSPHAGDHDSFKQVESEQKSGGRSAMTLTQLLGNIMEVDDPNVVAARLAKYPTQEQLDQELGDEIAEAERQRIAHEIAQGRMKPYPLEQAGIDSEQMTIWQSHLAEIFEFFVDPLDEQFKTSESVDDVFFLVGKCFRTLDCDQDGIISMDDACEAFAASGSSRKLCLCLSLSLFAPAPTLWHCIRVCVCHSFHRHAHLSSHRIHAFHTIDRFSV